MSNLALKADQLKEALKNYTKTVPIPIPTKGKTVSIPFSDQTKDLIEFLRDSLPLTPAQKAKIVNWLTGPEKISQVEADSVSELFDQIEFMNSTTDPVLEVKINDKWYPIPAQCSKFKGFMGGWMMDLQTFGVIGGMNYTTRAIVGEWDFEDHDSKPIKKHINEILKKNNLRVTTPEAVAHAKKLAAKAAEINANPNKVYDTNGAGLRWHQWWGWDEMAVGWKGAPSTVIVESTLENPNAGRLEMVEDGSWHLPFVRVFSLKHKDYLFADAESMTQHVFHPDSKKNIVLPTKMMGALDSIFNSKQENLFGDIFHGRHGGIVVLANGPSGVGKTLTAEVFAEYQQRPLYSMEMGEIGTSLKEVEANLGKIFARAKKWNAVLLFDEADIFLSERVASDLERSAIVGIFLRLLDYYEGTFFLTTNRGEGIDNAFKSRVTLYLNYPELSVQTKHAIWEKMLSAANMEVTEDVSWEQVASEKLNGRQIRNQVRLLKLMFPDNKIKTSDIMESLDFAAK